MKFVNIFFSTMQMVMVLMTIWSSLANKINACNRYKSNRTSRREKIYIKCRHRKMTFRWFSFRFTSMFEKFRWFVSVPQQGILWYYFSYWQIGVARLWYVLLFTCENIFYVRIQMCKEHGRQFRLGSVVRWHIQLKLNAFSFLAIFLGWTINVSSRCEWDMRNRRQHRRNNAMPVCAIGLHKHKSHSHII